MLRFHAYLIPLVASAAACHPAPTLLMPPPEAEASVGPVPGTYAVWFCRHDCAVPQLAHSAEAYGFIVLDTVPLADWRGTHTSRADRLSRGQGRLPGACYLIVGHHTSPSAAASIGHSMSGWRRVAPDSATSLLFERKADRSYIGAVRIDTASGRLHGIASSTDAGLPSASRTPVDTIIGRRIGPIDRAMCDRRLAEAA